MVNSCEVNSANQATAFCDSGAGTVTVTEALVLRPLLEYRGRITESIFILVPVDRMKQKCFQIMMKQVRRSQQFHLRRYNMMYNMRVIIIWVARQSKRLSDVKDLCFIDREPAVLSEVYSVFSGMCLCVCLSGCLHKNCWIFALAHRLFS